MKQVWLQSIAVTLMAIIGSLLVCWSVLAFEGKPLEGEVLLLSVLSPVLLGFPIVFFLLYQKRKVRLAHQQLSAAHDELAAVHRRLAEKARRDDLTGLLNRGAFVSAIEATRGHKARGCLLVVDADNFKQINDRFGHLAGDETLRRISGAIRENVRRSDFQGRLGGEEFGIFLCGADLANAYVIAERLRMAVEKIAFAPQGKDVLRITVSIGIAEAPTLANFPEIMAKADKRLYEAKERGRNLVVMPAERDAA